MHVILILFKIDLAFVQEEQDIQMLYQLIGARIRSLRIEKGYSSQENFAYDAEIPRAQYGKYEKGVNLTILSLYKVLKFHKMTFEEFFQEDFTPLNKNMNK